MQFHSKRNFTQSLNNVLSVEPIKYSLITDYSTWFRMKLTQYVQKAGAILYRQQTKKIVMQCDDK